MLYDEIGALSAEDLAKLSGLSSVSNLASTKGSSWIIQMMGKKVNRNNGKHQPLNHRLHIGSNQSHREGWHQYSHGETNVGEGVGCLAELVQRCYLGLSINGGSLKWLV